MHGASGALLRHFRCGDRIFMEQSRKFDETRIHAFAAARHVAIALQTLRPRRSSPRSLAQPLSSSSAARQPGSPSKECSGPGGLRVRSPLSALGRGAVAAPLRH